MSERASWYTYLPLLVFPFLIFAPIILSGKALFWGTPLTQFIPWWKYAWEAVLKGVVPVWNDLLGMGAPLIANYQSALFYPPTWLYLIMYSIGDISLMAWFQAVMVVINLVWASFGMAFLVRQLRLGRLAQVIGGLSFGLSGYLVARAGFLSINAAVAWMPWIILGATKLAEANVRRWWFRREGQCTRFELINQIFPATLVLIVCMAMQLLAGHAQTTWYSVLLASIWFLYFSISRPWSTPAKDVEQVSKNGEVELPQRQPTTKDPRANHIRKTILHPIISGILLFVAAMFIAIALAAIQLLPTFEYLLESQRSAAVDFDFAMNYSFWPWRLLSLLTPDLFGNPAVGDYWGFANYWEDAIYIGLIPFVLAVAALLTRGRDVRDKTFVKPGITTFLLILILITFIIALGRNTPIFPWLYKYIPTFDMFQAPTRITILAVFSLSILAAIGADSWHRPRDRMLYWLRLGIMAAAAITIGAGLALLLSRSFPLGIRPSFIRAAALLGIWGTGLGILTLRAPLNKAIQPHQKWGWWQWAVVLWVGIDLVVAGWGLNPGVDLEVYREESPTTQEIKSMLDGGRLYLPADDEEQLKFNRFLRFDTFHPFKERGEWGDLRAVQLPNVTVLDGISSVNNFDPLLPGRYTRWMNELEGANLEKKERMLNLMGVTVVETLDSSHQYGIRFDQREAYPRIRWSSCGILVDSGEAALNLVFDNLIDLEDKVILEESAEFCSPQGQPTLGIISSTANKISLESSSQESGYLVIADVWYPEWRAYVDGKSVPVLRANYLFKAIPVPNGEHEITVVYQPRTFYLGAALSLVAIIGLMTLAVIWLQKSRSKIDN